MKKKLRIGVIGTGFIGKQHIEAIRRIPGTEVAAIADNNEAMAKSVCDELCIPTYYLDYHDLMMDSSIDVIHNCTPSFLHYPISMEAMKNKKAVYCEKPLALNTKESKSMADFAQEHCIKTGVNFNYRHNAMVQEMHERIKMGLMGKILMVHGEYLQDWLLYDTDFDWRLDPKKGGDSRAVADIGSHCFDTAQWIMGENITSIYAHLMTMHPVRKRCEKREGTFSNEKGSVIEEVKVSSEDAAFIMGTFESGTPFLFNISQVCAGKKNGLSITVSGEKNSLEWHQEKPDQLWIGHRDQGNEILYADAKYLLDPVKKYSHLPAGHPPGWHDALTNAIAAFYESIWQQDDVRQPSYVDFQKGNFIMQLVEASLESNRTNQWITL